MQKSDLTDTCMSTRAIHVHARPLSFPPSELEEVQDCTGGAAPKQGRRPTLNLLEGSEAGGLNPWGQRSRGSSAPAEEVDPWASLPGTALFTTKPVEV